MKKKCLSILCLLLLFVSVALPVHAAGSSSRLVDNADYLTDSEEATLLNKLDEISTRQGLDIVIVTISDLYGEDITAFADDFYDENGYQPDGILLLISDYDREWAISTAGYGITAFTDAGQEYLTGQFLNALSEGEYASAFDTYADLCDEFITQAKAGTPYDVGSLPKGAVPYGKEPADFHRHRPVRRIDRDRLYERQAQNRSCPDRCHTVCKARQHEYHGAPGDVPVQSDPAA